MGTNLTQQYGDLYSKYYDLLYLDKDYEGEAKYIEVLISKNCINAFINFGVRLWYW
jgi:hypothetical protein